MVEHVRPGMIFYDLGANAGFFSLLAARMVGTTGKVFSFEADPEVAQRLRGNVDRNGFKNVRVIQKAAWSLTGSVIFSRSNESRSPERGWGKVVSSPARTQNTVAVPCTSLDDFARTEPPPDFIKCDVEGAECEVFKGARKMLAKHTPLVACEVHSDQNRAQLTQLFHALHYSLTWFTPAHFLASPHRSS
jgi:FkbM family methyltransferase